MKIFEHSRNIFTDNYKRFAITGFAGKKIPISIRQRGFRLYWFICNVLYKTCKAHKCKREKTGCNQ